MSSSLVVKSTCHLLHFWPSAVFFYDTNIPILDHITELIYSRLSHIDNINHTNLLVAVALLFPLMWRLVLITEPSRGLTQFVNPRVPLSASLLRSLLCRAELGPLPGWEWGWWRWCWGGDREGWQPALGPHAGMQEVDSREEEWRGYRGQREGHRLGMAGKGAFSIQTYSNSALWYTQHGFTTQVCVWWGRCIYYFR